MAAAFSIVLERKTKQNKIMVEGKNGPDRQQRRPRIMRKTGALGRIL
jgi:hypothetical protein